MSILELKVFELKEKFKYYYWTTFFLYEFVGILSIVAYASVFVDVWSVREERPYEIFENVLIYVAAWIYYCSFWSTVFHMHILFIVRKFDAFTTLTLCIKK